MSLRFLDLLHWWNKSLKSFQDCKYIQFISCLFSFNLGQKYVTNGGRKNTDCSPLKYQPFKFWSNKLSQCVFKKSMCSEFGQILNWNSSSMTDSTCRCDYTAGFAFVSEPRNKCFCKPSEEDCMCYIISCPTNMGLNQGKINKPN